MKHKSLNFLSIFIIALTPFSLMAGEPIGQSLVEDEVQKRNNAGHVYIKDKNAEQTPSDAAMLFHIPGLTITDRGGAMGEAQVNFRGLSGSRFSTNLDGLQLNNPATGIIDANSMFLFAAKYLQSNAQSLSIALPTIVEPQAKGVFGYGSQNALKLGGCAGTPIGRSSIYMATQLTSSDGQFYFSSPEDKNTKVLRENNDHHRVQTLIKYEGKGDNFKSHALFAVNFHESGIPGYAFSPTKSLRNYTAYSGLALGVSTTIKDFDIRLEAVNSLFNYRSTDIPKKEEQFMASTHEITLGMKSLKWLRKRNLDFELAPKLVIERAYELDKTRIGGGFLMKRSMTFSGKLKPSTSATFSMLGFHKHGLVFKKDFSMTIEPTNNLSLTGRFMRQQRLPTFMELYANNSFFAGNEDLKKESIWDLELGSNLRLGEHMNVGLNAFMGFLSDTIVYVPFRVNQTRPTNVSSARRYGLDTAVSYEPKSWLLLESKNSLLYTKTNYGTTLPNAPMFSGLSRIRLGEEDFLSLSLQMRYRSSAAADLYGSLRTKSYALCDSILSTRILERVGLSFSVSNIFNVRTARDTYEIPLSGTVFFAQIDVGNI